MIGLGPVVNTKHPAAHNVHVVVGIGNTCEELEKNRIDVVNADAMLFGLQMSDFVEVEVRYVIRVQVQCVKHVRNSRERNLSN